MTIVENLDARRVELRVLQAKLGAFLQEHSNNEFHYLPVHDCSMGGPETTLGKNFKKLLANISGLPTGLQKDFFSMAFELFELKENFYLDYYNDNSDVKFDSFEELAGNRGGVIRRLRINKASLERAHRKLLKTDKGLDDKGMFGNLEL